MAPIKILGLIKYAQAKIHLLSQKTKSLNPWINPLLKICGFINLVTLLIVLFLSLLVSIYPDELTYVMQGKRLIQDSFQLFNVTIQCNEYSFLSPVSSSLFKFVDSILYSATSPIILRLYGIVVFLAWMFLLSYSLRLHYKTPWYYFAFFNIGVFPFASLTNRPESNIILGVTTLLCFTEALKNKKNWTRKREFLAVTAYLLVAAYIFSAHAKATGFLPFVFLALVPVSLSLTARVIAALGVFSITAEHYLFANARADFTGCPSLGEIASRLYLRPSMIISNFQTFYRQGIHNLLETLRGGLGHMLFQDSYQGQWLDGFAINNIEAGFNTFIVFIVRILVLITCCLVAYKTIKNYRQPRQYIVSLSLLGSILAIRSLENYSHWYLITLYFPIIVIIFLREICDFFGKKGVDVFIILFTAFSIANSYLLVSNFLPQATTNLARPATEDVRPIPFAINELSEINRDLKAFASSQCGISDKSNRLVLDDVSYYSYVSSHQPLSLHYLIGYWGNDIPDLKRLLINHRSDGLVLFDCNPLKKQKVSDSIDLIFDKESRMCCAKAFR